jgi:RNA polymerase sigma-70 factor (ECF subfamily)
MQALKEKKLVYIVQKEKDTDAFAELYDFYVSKMYRFVYFKLSNKEEAEDLVSELFLKAWYYLTDDHNKQVRSFSGFMYRMARNMIVDVYRERAKNVDIPDSDLPNMVQSDNTLMEEVSDKTEADRMLQYIKQLKQEYQDIVLLKHVEGFSNAEIADILQKSRTNVRVTLHRAMKVLRDMIEHKEKKHDA